MVYKYNIFHELPHPQIDELASFSLVPAFYENEMAKRNSGAVISSHESIKSITTNQEAVLRKFVPAYSRSENKRNNEVIEQLVEIYENIDGPCSMAVNTVEELEQHMLNAYQISYAHYAVAYKDGMTNMDSYENITYFPRLCCDISGINLMLSLMAFGYPNASYVSSDYGNHCYTIMPFKYKEEKGIILIDPTSDQLWSNIEKRPRNMVSVYLLNDKNTWEYKTDWSNGADLFPSGAMHIGALKKHHSKKRFLQDDSCYDRIEPTLEKAFANPINLANIEIPREIVNEISEVNNTSIISRWLNSIKSGQTITI